MIASERQERRRRLDLKPHRVRIGSRKHAIHWRDGKSHPALAGLRIHPGRHAIRQEKYRTDRASLRGCSGGTARRPDPVTAGIISICRPVDSHCHLSQMRVEMIRVSDVIAPWIAVTSMLRMSEPGVRRRCRTSRKGPQIKEEG
jgi:hypothetical protein